MMENVFLQVINMSITSSYVIFFVIVLRMLLKRAPKIFSYVLWSVVFFRLVFPFSFESIFSLISINTEAIPHDIVYTQTPQINSGISIIDGAINNSLPSSVVDTSVNPVQVWITIGLLIWLVGIISLIIYSIVSTMKLVRTLKGSMIIDGNIYETDNITTPFVFGLLNPKIYLPTGLSESERPYIIRHEETHIKRLDHIIKPLAFLVVIIHWFNPLAWVAFFLLSRDMELSCDEKVIKDMGSQIKKDYSNSLLSLAIGKRIINGAPLAFGENNTKGRIKNILNYRKPGFWVTIISIMLIIVVGIGLLSNPLNASSDYKIDKTKVVQVTLQNLSDGVITKLDSGIWDKIVNEVNNSKWSELAEEDWPGEEKIAFNITITLARDVSVDNKEYIVWGYRNKDKSFFGNEHEYALALTYDDLSGDIKIWSLPQNLYYKLRDILDVSNYMTIEDYANEFIQRNIQMYENPEGPWEGFKIVDSKITKLEKLSTFENILSSPVELWSLEYRLKPDDISKVVMAGGMSEEDGWITENTSMGKPYLVFLTEDDSIKYLGNLYPDEVGIETLALQEIAIRNMLERNGYLPYETYKGNHIVIQFPISTGETHQLLLSQPVVQGTKGIWVVERWMDGNGNIYNAIPQTDLRIDEYYNELQKQLDNKENIYLRDPVEVGYDFIINYLGQVLVKRNELIVIEPATIEDFMKVPDPTP